MLTKGMSGRAAQLRPFCVRVAVQPLFRQRGHLRTEHRGGGLGDIASR